MTGELAGTRVLVVDSNPRSLELLAAALLDSGFNVRTASSLAEALDEARRRPPTLVLSDAEMPNLNGLDLCAALRQVPELAAIPIVLLSARGARPRERAGNAASGGSIVGIADYLPKPVDLPGLVGVLRRLSA